MVDKVIADRLIGCHGASEGLPLAYDCTCEDFSLVVSVAANKKMFAATPTKKTHYFNNLLASFKPNKHII